MATSASDWVYWLCSDLGHWVELELWVEARALPFTGCVTLSKLHLLAGLPFPYL